MKEEASGSISSTSDKLIEHIKLAIGSRTLRQVEAANYIPLVECNTKSGSTREPAANDFITLREQAGMNRKEFSEYLGIPYSTMTDWERGMRQAPDYVLFNKRKG